MEFSCSNSDFNDSQLIVFKTSSSLKWKKPSKWVNEWTLASIYGIAYICVLVTFGFSAFRENAHCFQFCIMSKELKYVLPVFPDLAQICTPFRLFLISKSVMIFLFSSVLKHFLAISPIWHSPCSPPAGYSIFCPIFLYFFFLSTVPNPVLFHDVTFIFLASWYSNRIAINQFLPDTRMPLDFLTCLFMPCRFLSL